MKKIEPLGQQPDPPEKGMVYVNTFGLRIVPQGTDANKQSRMPLNLILHYRLVLHKTPPGFMAWQPAVYHHEEWLRAVPEEVYLRDRYQLNEILKDLHDLGVTDSKDLQVIVYATDYGRLTNLVTQKVQRLRNELYNNTLVTPEDQAEALRTLFDYIAQTCGYHYCWDAEIVAKDKARAANEDACRTEVQRELFDNPAGLPYVVQTLDLNGRPRIPFKKVYNHLTNNTVPPGFICNTHKRPYDGISWFLRLVPERTLNSDFYNLEQLCEWLDQILGMDSKDKIAVIYASDWGRIQTDMYQRVQTAVNASWITTPKRYLMAGFKQCAFRLVAGGYDKRKLVNDYERQCKQLARKH